MMRSNPQKLLFALCLATRALAQEPSPAFVAAVDKLVAKWEMTGDAPGIAILVQQPGKLSFQKGYGLANLKTRAAITPRTMFELASVTKTFTATAVLVLQERGKLSIEDELRKHLPEMPDYQKGRPVRIRDLLEHVSGLPDYMSLEDFPSRHKGYWDNDDYLPQFAKQRGKFPLSFAPGAKYEYNNTNYLLLASVIQKVTSGLVPDRRGTFAAAGG